jgi:hypothetical protein
MCGVLRKRTGTASSSIEGGRVKCPATVTKRDITPSNDVHARESLSPRPLPAPPLSARALEVGEEDEEEEEEEEEEEDTDDDGTAEEARRRRPLSNIVSKVPSSVYCTLIFVRFSSTTTAWYQPVSAFPLK